MTSKPKKEKISRREFVRSTALGTAALASGGLLGCRSTGPVPSGPRPGPESLVLPLDRDWRFGRNDAASGSPAGPSDENLSPVALPHCVSRLSWQRWDPSAWEDVWVYRRALRLPGPFRHRRVFLEFEGVMMGATPVINGQALPPHLGGYLPFHYEVTNLLGREENRLDVLVDSRWLNAPPEGSPKGPKAVDYLLPGGITRGVRLRAVPEVFIRDVFAKPVAVLGPNRRVEVACTLDAARLPHSPVELVAELLDGPRPLARASTRLRLESTGETPATLTLAKLGEVSLWDIATPRLYEVRVTLMVDREPVHRYRTRIGFREARFELDGFFLNGRRLQLFGLDRHEIYPFIGGAVPPRVARRDAELLRRDFNCNIVRCSHYPQTPAFLDACDELGLMVWEEIPGWQYIGDPGWQDLAVRDVRDMVRRDRNRPSVVIWGVRINESANHPALYARTRAAAKALDDSRPTSGAMNRYSTKDWLQEVYAFDDYHSAPDGSVGLRDPLPGVPYLLSEAVGQFEYGTGRGFGRKYRRAGDLGIQARQALAHAQAHSKAAANNRFCGLIAWCAFDYASLMNAHQGVKCPGVADVFRIPKLGAAFYLAQADPRERPVIEPNFYWDFGPQSPTGPGRQAAIFSNCERLDIFLDQRHHATVHPDRKGFPHLEYPPFFTDLTCAGPARPELRIDGSVGNAVVVSRRFSADTSKDQLFLHVDDTHLSGDGVDTTRAVFRAVDRFGAPRPFIAGQVTLEIEGPGVIIGDNPFSLQETGGAGAVYVRTTAGAPGRIRLRARHPALGERTVAISVARA